MDRFDQKEIDAVVEVIKSGTLSGFYKNPLGGRKIVEFEKAFKEYHGMNHAISVSSGTAGLHLSLLACGVQSGDEVITTPLTFSATATSILMCGAKPVFADVDPRTYNIDPEKVKELITDKTQAIIPVHLLGTPVDMDGLIEVADGRIFVVEDACQALGAKYNGKLCGTIGDISIFSGQETKTLSFGGEGGMILTNNEDMAEELRLLRTHGQQYGNAPFTCYNYRLTEMQAAFGLVQLKKLDLFNKMQVKNAKILFKHLPEQIHPPYIPDYAEPTLYIIGCLADDGFPREEFVKRLTEKGVNKNLPGSTVGLGYQKAIMELPLLKPYKRSCPIAEELVRHFIWFDTHRWLLPDEFAPIAKIIGET